MTAGPVKLYFYGHTFFYSPFISIAQRLPNGDLPNIIPTIDEYRGKRLAVPTPVQLPR